MRQGVRPQRVALLWVLNYNLPCHRRRVCLYFFGDNPSRLPLDRSKRHSVQATPATNGNQVSNVIPIVSQEVPEGFVIHLSQQNFSENLLEGIRGGVLVQ